ncbi:hypothetical protein C8J56DRAFT_823131 [Mycena floridula]|nr:hypothetical protein C8J56DRAFT_823131 [Mycena floridula]
MPAPYALIPNPPGDFHDIFDNQAMAMSVVHNQYIRGINAIVAQAPYINESQVPPFIHFCVVFLEGIHHHHALEEEFYFPEIEKRLGIDTMSANVDQHKAFVPQLHELEEYLKGVQQGSIKYDGEMIVTKLHSFTDPLIEHLNDEIITLESERLRKAFTKKQLDELNAAFVKRAVAGATLDGTLPLFLVCHDQEYAPWFDHVPWVIGVAVKYWFARKYRDSWAFGPSDLNSRTKPTLFVTPPNASK